MLYSETVRSFVHRQFHIVILHHPPTALPFCSGWCVQSKPCCWYRVSNRHVTPQLLSIPLDLQVKAAVYHPLYWLWVGKLKLPLLEPKWPEWQTSHPPSKSLQIVLHENSACYFFISRQFHIVILHHLRTALPFCSGWCVQSKPCCWYRVSNRHVTPQLLSIPLDLQVKAAVYHPPCSAQLCISDTSLPSRLEQSRSWTCHKTSRTSFSKSPGVMRLPWTRCDVQLFLPNFEPGFIGCHLRRCTLPPTLSS